eukprot:53013-Chlamydomonas_euryale.AAC.3
MHILGALPHGLCVALLLLRLACTYPTLNAWLHRLQRRREGISICQVDQRGQPAPTPLPPKKKDTNLFTAARGWRREETAGCV